MTSVINSVTSWLGGSRERDPSPSQESEKPELKAGSPVAEGGATESAPGDGGPEQEAGSGEGAAAAGGESKLGLPIDVDLHEVSEKAIHAAKEWGSYLFNVGKVATEQLTEQVTKTAKQLKDTVEEKTIIGEFGREQDKFLSENRDKRKQADAAVPPWVGYNEEEVMKSQILALSKDKRHFLRNPPAGVQFNFDYLTCYPVAMVMLEEDPDLKAMRFKIVPKEIKEEVFWRNYFYRVSLIKQSTQLTSLAQHAAKEKTAGGSKTEKRLSQPADSPAPTSTAVPAGDSGEPESDDLAVGSPPGDHEFVSDTYQTGSINRDELKKEMDQLGVSDKTTDSPAEKKKKGGDDVPEWERELQQELQEYEVVDDGNNVDDADLEREIMSQIEAETKRA